MRRTAIREAATKDGLPKKAFAYTPTNKPSDWKLPLYTAAGAPDPDLIPGAAAAFSPGGFRGQKVDIPADAVANVKAKIRAAYRKWKGSDAEYPDSIKEAAVEFSEAEGGPVAVTLREAVVLLDKSAVCATVIQLPNGDQVVIPQYDGQFQNLAKPYEPYVEDNSWQATYDVQDAGSALATLMRIRNHEQDDPGDAAMLSTAIDGLASFIKSEASEPVSESEINEALVTISEAGRRNSTIDQKALNAAHDSLHDAGAQHQPGKKYAGMPDMMAESAHHSAAVEFDPKATRQQIAFAEASEDGAVLVTLAESAPQFDDATRTVTITPIKPGFGNKRDGYYYPAETLREATEEGLFNGLKMFRNHPRKSDEKDLPERDVKDWFATTREASWDPVSESPRLPIVVHDAADYQRFKDAPDQIAFSVRGGGYAREGRVEGKEARIIESLAKVRSVDWVTEAGAGGAIAIAESAADEEFDVDIKKLSTEQLREELRLREAAEGAEGGDGAAAGDGSSDGAATTTTGAATEGAEGAAAGEATTEPTKGGEAPAMAPDGFVKADELPGLIEAGVAKALKDREEAAKTSSEVKEAAATVVADEIRQSTLTKPVKDRIAVRFAEAGWGNGYVYTDEQSLRDAVKGELAEAAALLAAAGKAPSPVKGLGATAPEAGSEGQTKISEAESELMARWGNDALPAKPKTVYEPGDLEGSDAGAKAGAGDGEAEVKESAAERAEADIAARMGLH